MKGGYRGGDSPTNELISPRPLNGFRVTEESKRRKEGGGRYFTYEKKLEVGMKQILYQD
jgi:hypothetical protein